jgi:hypothetical protein
MAVESSSRGNGLMTAWDTIVAPKAAFESIRVAPTWVFALATAMVVSGTSEYLITPALLHGFAGTFTHTLATDPHLATLTPEQQQQMLASGEKMLGRSWIYGLAGVPLSSLLAAVTLLIFDKIGSGVGTFAKYWAAACNIAVPFAIGSAVKAIIVLLRGADSFATAQDMQRVIPSLALLAPGTSAKLAILLSAITPFALWGFGLNVLTLRVIGNARPIAAWIAAIVLLLLPAVFLSLGVR